MNEMELIATAGHTSSTEGPPLRVLIVDDEQVSRAAIRHHLTRSCARIFVHEVDSADAALDAIESDRPDCILLDMHLGSSSGIQLVRELHGFLGSFAPPVIMVSGDESHRAGVDSMKVGVADFLAKSDLQTVDLPTLVMETVALDSHRKAAFTHRLRSFTRLVSRLAHEVNNPAAIGRLALSAALENLPEQQATDKTTAPDFDRIRKLLSSTDDALVRISHVIKDLESETGTSLGHVARVSLDQVVDSARARIKATTNSGVSIDFELAARSPLVGDAAQLARVVVDLVKNAADATGPGGRVHVITREERGFANLSVEDEGPGVAPEDMGIIFDPLFTTQAESGALGMGLARAMAITSRHGGTISIERSEKLGGARLLVRLPISHSLPTGPPRSRRRTPTRRHARVLVIDDEEMLRAHYFRVLSRQFEVAVAASAEEARSALSEAHFDAIICDVWMPEEDGVAFVRKLLKTDPEQAKRVVFCSGGIVDASMAAFVHRWENGCIAKPTTADDLIEHVEQLLDVAPKPPE